MGFEISTKSSSSDESKISVIEYENGIVPFKFPKESLISEVIDLGVKQMFGKHSMRRLRIVPENNDSCCELTFDYSIPGRKLSYDEKNSKIMTMYMILFLDVDYFVDSEIRDAAIVQARVLLKKAIRNI